MHQFSRPPAGPLPRRQAIMARLRHLEPRRVLLRLVIGLMALAVVDVGLHWRSTIEALGTTVTVATVQREVPAGSVLGHDDIALVDWPAGLVPIGAARHLPIGATVRSDLATGEALIERRLFPDQDGLDIGDRLVTVPLSMAPARLTIGARVELYGIRTLGDTVTTGSARLTTGLVVETSEEFASIAVTEAAVPVLLDHMAHGVIDIVVRP